MSDPILGFNSKTFTEQLHTRFTVRQASGTVSLELVEVKEPPSPSGIELFTLLFQGPKTPHLEQKIHNFEHAKLGAFGLFITAISGDHEGISYEAVFHRVKKKER